MTIKYKVVYKDTRLSTSAKGLYCIVYNKGTTVEKLPNTLGIMVFKDRQQAQRFMLLNLTPSFYMILRVKTFTRGVVPKKISLKISSYYLDMFYKKSWKMAIMSPPRGTICYDKVEVLD